MTDAELLKLADRFAADLVGDYASFQVSSDDMQALAKGVIALSARLTAVEKARGEVIPACPHCDSIGAEYVRAGADDDQLRCRECQHVFTEFTYWQRVSKP